MALTQSARGGGVAVLSGFDHRNPKHPKIVISSDDGRRRPAPPPGRDTPSASPNCADDRAAGMRATGFVGPGIAASRLPRADSSCRDTSLAPDAAPPRAGDERP